VTTTLTGTARLVRFVLRRDRVRLPLWVGGITGLLLVSAASLPAMFPDHEAIDAYVSFAADNPAVVAFAGPGYGFDDPNIGVILVNETQIFGALAVALMSLFLFTRHTRGEEDTERAELIGSSVVGRHATTTAAAVVVTGANLVVGSVLALGFVLIGYPTVGSIALAASVACVGIVFTGVAATTAQLAAGNRAALGLGALLLGGAFTARAIGDVGDSPLSWTSPMAWAIGVRAFAGERWWVLLLCVALAGALLVLAYWLRARRDLGAGILPLRLGPPSAARWMTNPIGLAVRLQRGALTGWVVGMVLLGILYGAIADGIDELLEASPQLAEAFLAQEGVSLVDSFFATAMVQVVLITSGFTIASVLRLRSEESAGRAEPVLATPTSRRRWAAGHLLIAVAGTTAIVALTGLGMGAAYAVTVNDAGEIPRLVGAALVTVPAALVLGASALALFGLRPQLAPVAWALLAGSVAVGILGDLLRLPAWARALSPADHIPAVPAHPVEVLPLLVLTLLAVALGAAGLWGLRRREINVT
jgi:ABC-2 type transport system permease protein